VKVSSRDALAATRLLLEKEGIFAGISSGAVLHVALRVASEMKEGNICCLFADGGWKYLSTRAWAGTLEEAAARLEKMIWA
jgi:cysteine synthase B